MTSVEFKLLSQMLNEVREEMRSLRNGVDSKIESVAKTVMEAFQGFGILDPDEDYWTGKQVCEKYHIDRKTLYTWRMEGKIPFVKNGESKNSSIRYRKADVIEFFAARNA